VRAASYKAIIILGLVFTACVIVGSRFHIANNLTLFLPEPDTEFERLLHHQLDKSASSSMVFLAFSGLPENDLSGFNQRITKKLRDSKTFSRVTNNAENLSDDLLVFLVKYRYLLTHNDLSNRFSASELKLSLQQRLQGLASSAAPMEKRYLRQDPTGEISGLLNDWQGKVSRHKRPIEINGVWFSDDRNRTLVLVEIAADISQMENQAAAVKELRELYDSMRLPGMEHIMVGPAVFAVETGEDIQKDIKWLTLIAIVLVTLFLFAAYRSLKTVFLVICPLVAGVAVAMAAILLLYDEIQGITLAFGITLIGVAVDYPIHLLACLRGDKAQNRTDLVKIWSTLKLGVFSTVVAYGAFLVSSFEGLRQLGLFTIIGLITAAIFSRWVLPAFVYGSGQSRPGLDNLNHYLKIWAQRASALRWTVVVGALLSLGLLSLSNVPVLHLNVDSLSPVTESRRAEGRLLRSDLGFWYGGSMMMIAKKDNEAVLQYSENIQSYLDVLVEDHAIDGYDMASHILPSRQRQSLKKSQIIDIQSLNANLTEALIDMPFRKNIFDPFIEDVRKAKLLEVIDPESLRDTAIGEKLSPLLFEFENVAGGVILLHGINDDAKMKQFADDHDGLYYMHLKTASTDLVSRSVDRVALSMLGCIVLIYLALAFAFKNINRPLKIMIPSLSAAIVTAAILVLSGNPLSIFHLISLLLVVGLGLDYALFFNRLPENENEWETTFKSLWVCAVTTILVFGILMFSHTPPLEAIGETVGLGAFISIVFAAMWAATAESPRLDTSSPVK
jgi:predicted exporter